MNAYITVNMDNAAFCDARGEELARILRDLAAQIEAEPLNAGEHVTLADFNGNNVGDLYVRES